MAYGKKNVIKIDPLSYNIGLIGESGVGKTTLVKQVCEKLAGEDGYLFLECGKEDGADAISGINYINCPEWSMDYDEDTNSIGFEELTDDIMENKTSEYPNLRTVIIDTYDQLVDMAVPEVIAMHNREYKDKPVKSINAAFGGYGAGLDKINDIVLERLWDLKKVGVHFIIIGHVKQRSQEDAITGQTYNTLTTNMSLKAFNAIKTKLHFLGVAYIDRSIAQEKTGKKDNKNNDIMKGIITGESRRITFRDDNYSVDSKSRFADIVHEINLDPDEFIKAITDAISAEAKKGVGTISENKEEQEAAEARRMQKIAEQEAARKEKKVLDGKLNELKEFIQTNKGSVKTKISPLMELAKKHGYKNPVEIDSIEVADELLKLASTL